MSISKDICSQIQDNRNWPASESEASSPSYSGAKVLVYFHADAVEIERPDKPVFKLADVFGLISVIAGVAAVTFALLAFVAICGGCFPLGALFGVVILYDIARIAYNSMNYANSKKMAKEDKCLSKESKTLLQGTVIAQTVVRIYNAVRKAPLFN